MGSERGDIAIWARLKVSVCELSFVSSSEVYNRNAVMERGEMIKPRCIDTTEIVSLIKHPCPCDLPSINPH